MTESKQKIHEESIAKVIAYAKRLGLELKSQSMTAGWWDSTGDFFVYTDLQFQTNLRGTRN